MKRCALPLLLTTPLLAYAGEAHYTPAFGQCMDRADGVTAAMHDCMAAEWAVQDVKLNRVYKRLGDVVTPARKKQLLTAQRLWLKYRDANCQFYADPDGGTLAGIAAHNCSLELTAQRADELDALTRAGDSR